MHCPYKIQMSTPSKKTIKHPKISRQVHGRWIHYSQILSACTNVTHWNHFWPSWNWIGPSLRNTKIDITFWQIEGMSVYSDYWMCLTFTHISFFMTDTKILFFTSGKSGIYVVRTNIYFIMDLLRIVGFTVSENGTTWQCWHWWVTVRTANYIQGYVFKK